MAIIDDLLKTFKKKESAITIAPVLPKDIYEAGVLELRDIIAPSALKVTPRDLNLGDKLVRTFFVISYPRFLTDNWFSPIINLDKIFDISISIHPVETSGVLKEFRKKVAEVQSQIHLREEKGMVRDPVLDTAYQDLENLRDQLQQAQEKLFDVALYISIYANTEDELNRLESEIKSILESKLVYLKPALFQQEQGFRSVLPIAADELQIFSKLNTSPLSSIFPFVSFDLTSDKGILYGINRHNSSLVLFDRFSLENYNSIIFAKSGSGKSIRGREPVLVRRRGVVELIPIGELVEQTIGDRGYTQIDHELEGTIDPGFEVFSFGRNLRGAWSKVSLAARKAAPDTFYTFTTKSGRVITTTGDHNMVVLRAGQLIVAKSTDVIIGERVPLPRFVETSFSSPSFLNVIDILSSNPRIYVSGGAQFIAKHYRILTSRAIDASYDRYLSAYRRGRRVPIPYFIKLLTKLSISCNDIELTRLRITSASGKSSLPVRLPLNTALTTLFGYVASEGTICDRVVVISNIDPHVLADIRRSYNAVGLHCYDVPRAIVCSSVPFVALVRAIGASGTSGRKRVAPVVFGLQKEAIGAYLRAYFEGDGGVDGAQITALSKSKGLISDIAYLLYFFGIVARIHERRKIYVLTGRKRVFWQLSISGQENLSRFATNVGFVTYEKQRGLDSLIKKTSNTNVDTIPGVHVLFNEIYALFASQLHNIPSFHAVRRGLFDPSPRELQAVVGTVRDRVRKFQDLGHVFSKFRKLPSLHALIALSESDRELNKRMWRLLGSSWAAIRNEKHQTRAHNALAFIGAVRGESETQTISEVKDALREGFQSLDLSIVGMNSSLPNALTAHPASNTSYETLKDAADFASAAYDLIAAHLPRIEAILNELDRLAKADLFWDPIARIDVSTNRRDMYVYDLTVDDGVFLAGTAGMIIHNSYATKLEILRTLMFETEVIVLDPEREYEYLAAATGGRYFNISLTSEHHINPFELPIAREDEPPANVLRSHIVTLVGLFRIMLGNLTPEEDAIIDRAITETYALKDITGDADFKDVEPPLLSDFELVLAGMEGAESLVQRLSKYTKGTWSGFINKPTNVDINKKFVVFSVRDMEDELKPVAMYIVTHYIWRAVRKELKKRLLVVDEAHWMMRSEDTASFLFSIAKRGRKYFLGLATITQDVGDFLNSPYGLPIITNSSIQLLLKQSPTSIDTVQKTFNLTDEEKYLLLESDVGEGIFFAGLKHVAIKIIASYTEDQIITSDPSQLLAIKAGKAELAATKT